MTPRRVPGGALKPAGKAKFSTPFKPGMAPGEAGRTQLEARARTEVSTQTPVRVGVQGTPLSSTKGKSVARKEYKCFDLSECMRRDRTME